MLPTAFAHMKPTCHLEGISACPVGFVRVAVDVVINFCFSCAFGFVLYMVLGVLRVVILCFRLVLRRRVA
jgi:hypothetical protein